MAAPSVTNTFTTGTTILASEMNQNFDDVINGITDASKDLSFGKLTTAGDNTLNGLTALRGMFTNSSNVLVSVAPDSCKIVMGTGSDCEIYHDGTDFHIDPEASGSTTAFVINETGADVDLRVEGDTATQLLVCDASADSVEIGTTSQGNIVKINSTGINLQANMDLIGSSTSDITINTNKFTVAGSSGDVVSAGTVQVGTLLGVGAAPGANIGAYVGTTATTGVIQYGAYIEAPMTGSTAGGAAVYAALSIDTTGITNGIGIQIADSTLANGGTITTQFGLKVEDQTQASGLKYAIYTGTGTTRLGDSMTTEGTIKLKERAAAEVDNPAYGQLWVKNTTPCELWYTDDQGTDTQIV